MKKASCFFALLLSIVLMSSCHSKLGKSSSENDTVSYVYGMFLGNAVVENRLTKVNVNDIVDGMKKYVAAPDDSSNLFFTVNSKFNDYIKNTSYESLNWKHVGVELGKLWAHNLNDVRIKHLNLSYMKSGYKDFTSRDTNALQIKPEAADKFFKEYKNRRIAEENQHNLEAGLKFLAENKTKQGVVTTESGLQYKIINEGSGNIIAKGDSVAVEVTLKLVDGEIINKDEKKTYNPWEERMLKGFAEGLQKLTKEGAEYVLYVPSELAFGKYVSPWIDQRITPNSALIYDIKVEKIIRKNK